MTENDTTTDAAEVTDAEAQETTDQTAGSATPDEAPVAQDAGEDEGRGNREAAKYRRQLRDVEAERDALRGQLTAARAELLAQVPGLRIAEGAHGEVFSEPDAMFSVDGSLNRAAIDAHVATLRTERPYLFDMQRLYIPAEGRQPEHVGSSRGWSDAFGPRD